MFTHHKGRLNIEKNIKYKWRTGRQTSWQTDEHYMYAVPTYFAWQNIFAQCRYFSENSTYIHRAYESGW